MKINTVCFAPDGEYVLDFPRDTIEEVAAEIENMGSRWIFYPIVAIATHKTIIDFGSDDLSHLNGKRISTVLKRIGKHNVEICEAINNGDPLYHIPI